MSLSLESGAIILAEVRPGDAADSTDVTERVMAAVGTLVQAAPEAGADKLGSELAADEGYFSIEEIAQLQRCGVRTVIADPQAERRRPERASSEHRAALNRASRALRSKSGKALLRRRGEHLERGFCHLRDHGGLRRATLRGCEKLTKRQLVAAAAHNLSLLLRHLFGIGTPKQLLAAAWGKTRHLLTVAIGTCLAALLTLIHRAFAALHRALPLPSLPTYRNTANMGSSTGC